jgi:CMP-N-acetylneuraminic acid synthetase
LQTRLWDRSHRPINHDPSLLIRTQDLPPVYHENSCIYLFERDGFMTRRNRIGERPILFETDPSEAWDIDEPFDWAVAEALMYQRLRGSEGSLVSPPE